MQLVALLVILAVVIAVVIDVLARHAWRRPEQPRDEAIVTTQKIIVDLTKRR